ncbi:MAG: aldehyde dehydrogenase family protein [Myxococcales bacterium]|nr:aldehyde dehydrogenase family protein [Myxococcales bacterium]
MDVIENRSPADLSLVLSRHPWSLDQVDEAVAAARKAFTGERRVDLVRKIGAVLEAHEEELARAIALDVGKPLWEARTEAQACAAKATITADEGMKLVAGSTQGSLELRFRPIGVLAVLGPFNFPVHLPNGHILPAIACGNCVVFKPSEVAPHAAEVYATCLAEAGVPPGVFNLVQGGPAVGAALSAHPGVDGVLFTGSWTVGQAIRKATQGQAKMLALEMGGKNAAIVLADADFDKAVYDVLFSAFVSAGQRCTAASRAIVVGDARKFARRIAQLAQQLAIGHPFDEGVFMGPLASPAALDKFERGLKEAGEEVVLGSRRVKPRGLDGCYVTPSVHLVQTVRNVPYQREELFGPDLAVYPAASEEEAVAIANSTDYGLAASVHTRSQETFDRVQRALECGVVNWNAPTVGASGRLPFGGLKRSGNHRPAALWSTLYCAAPVAVMRGEAGLDRTKLAPGVAWIDE